MLQLITLVILDIMVSTEIDLLVPALPELQRTFGLTPFMVEMTLAVNLTSYYITCLVVGNLADRYGRKLIILIGCVTFVVGSILCVFSNFYWQILLGRFFQGIGAASPAVLIYVVIADMYKVSKQQKLMGLLNGISTLSVAAAPVIGSYINLWMGWRGNFDLLLILGIVGTTMLYLFVKDDRHCDATVKISLKEYYPLFKSGKALLYITTFMCIAASYWIFISISPLLYIGSMGVSLHEFGFYQGALAITFSLSSFTSGYVIGKLGQNRCLKISMLLIILFVLGNFVLIIANVHDPLTITLVQLISSVAIAYPVNILWPLALEAVPNSRGRMSAIIVASRLMLTSLGIQFISYFYNHTFTNLGLMKNILMITALFSMYMLMKKGYVDTIAKTA